MAAWTSIPLEIAYHALGWTAFISWIIGPWLQVILNFRRKRVVRLNFDFVVLNLTKQTSYLIYNATLYFSSDVQQQYFEKYGFKEVRLNSLDNFSSGYHKNNQNSVCRPSDLQIRVVSTIPNSLETCTISSSSPDRDPIYYSLSAQFSLENFSLKQISVAVLLQRIPVIANDVAFSTHAVLLVGTTLFQIAIYECSELLEFVSSLSCHNQQRNEKEPLINSFNQPDHSQNVLGLALGLKLYSLICSRCVNISCSILAGEINRKLPTISKAKKASSDHAAESENV